MIAAKIAMVLNTTPKSWRADAPTTAQVRAFSLGRTNKRELTGAD
jgi:hypothetical protein